jgi:CheY-like chemotaxis protein
LDILVADDDRDIADIIGYSLRKEGHRPIRAHTGEEALALAERQRPDLVVLDVMLPGLSGFDVCRKLRERGPIPVILLTARGEEADRGGFDTHANQKTAHAALMTNVSEGLTAFQRDLESMGKADSTLILSFSEFGRRVCENGSGGTDHGAAGPMFAIGSSIRHGLYGEAPSLTNLDDGDLRYTVDFRSVYATVLENWFAAPSQAILGGSYERLGFLG